MHNTQYDGKTIMTGENVRICEVWFLSTSSRLHRHRQRHHHHYHLQRLIYWSVSKFEFMIGPLHFLHCASLLLLPLGLQL
jgi:hypothetical protein